MRGVMNMNAAELLDPAKVANGPMVVYWGQEVEEFWVKPTPLDFGAEPKRRLRHRIARTKPWRFTLRLEPTPAEESLTIFGERIALRFGQTLRGPPSDTDTAIWQTGSLFARDAPRAIGSVARLLPALDGINVAAVQVRVEAWERAT